MSVNVLRWEQTVLHVHTFLPRSSWGGPYMYAHAVTAQLQDRFSGLPIGTFVTARQAGHGSSLWSPLPASGASSEAKHPQQKE